MAKSVSAKSAARQLRKSSGGTFIQRSREKPSAEKAAIHNVTGAGRSKVIRRFFDLTQADQDQAALIMEAAIAAGL